MTTSNPPANPAGRTLRASAAAALVLVLGIATPRAAGNDVTPPPVPGDLLVRDGSTAYLIGHAKGTQNYACVPSVSSPSGFGWTLFGPQATLFDDNTSQIMTHFLSANLLDGVLRPTWQHSGDTSSAWAAAVATSTDADFVAEGAIPWLLLEVKGTAYGPTAGAKLIRTTYIQRVNTAGGMAPTTGCSQYSDVGKKVFVPYWADYVFYRK